MKLAAIALGVLFACPAVMWGAPPSGEAFLPIASALGAGEADGCFPPLASGGFRYRGARTCQSTACHGSLAPQQGKIRRNEYTIWRAKDPHAKAYTNMSLDNPLGAQILKNLGIAKDNKIVDQAGYQSCEKCHNLSVPIEKFEGAEVLREGVSCEACHGPSEKWYVEHYKTGFSRAEAVSKRGFTDTDNLFIRARLCVQCHVGAADREVNHDLLAAGHPQLRFELAAYMHLYPKHWNDAVERATKEQVELRLWTAGQIASADAALAQLEARAKRAAAKAPGSVWPEFAEMDCFACHHDLEPDSWRQKRGFGTRTPGDLPWGTWYFSLIQQIASKDQAPVAQQFHSHLGALKKTLEDELSPDPGAVAKQAHAARQALYQWAQPDGTRAVVMARPERLFVMFDQFTPAGPNGIEGEAAVETWETATQLYLAASALDEAYRDESKKISRADTPDDRTIANRIKDLRKDLAYAAGYDSPREFGGLSERSPREKVRNDLLQLFKQLKGRTEK